MQKLNNGFQRLDLDIFRKELCNKDPCLSRTIDVDLSFEKKKTFVCLPLAV